MFKACFDLILFLCNPFRVLQLICGPVLPRVARFSNTLGYPMQPFQGKKLKIPRRAGSQQTEAALSRLQVLGSRMRLVGMKIPCPPYITPHTWQSLHDSPDPAEPGVILFAEFCAHNPKTAFAATGHGLAAGRRGRLG